MDSILDGLADLIRQNTYIAPLMALLAGILTSVTPCALSGIPLVVATVPKTGISMFAHSTQVMDSIPPDEP